MQTRVKLLVTWLVLCIAGSAQQSPEFKYVQFDVPGAILTRPNGVNGAGSIVGLYLDDNGNPHAFLRPSGGTYISFDVPFPGASFTNATGINGGGYIVGRWKDSSGFNHGYLRKPDGTFSSFDPTAPCAPTSLPTVPHGINDVGEIVGRCFDANGKELGFIRTRDGIFTILDFPGALTTDAWAADNHGVIVGDYTDASGLVHGFKRTLTGEFITIDVPGNSSGLREINERGEMSGLYGASVDGPFHNFLLRNGTIIPVDYPGALSNNGIVINNSGFIVGGFIDTNLQEHGFCAVQCPPSGCQ